MKKFIFIPLAVLFFCTNSLSAQIDYDVIRNNWIQFSDAPNALYKHFAGQAYAFLQEREAAIEKITTLEEWQDRQKLIKKTLSDVVGAFPERTPLNARVMRTVTKSDYKIEHIVYESVPGFLVTSSLFIPRQKTKKKLPAVIFCSGHAGIGYRTAGYQHPVLSLVKKGFIVLAFDPVGQGERLQYQDTVAGKPVIKGPVPEHSYPGAQALISGDSQARYMIWDGIRAVDYLLTRKEVDPDNIGITGRSGGGTQTAYIAAFDERIKAAAPECYLTNFTRLIQNIGPQDAEQNFTAGIFHGLDEADLLLVRAPKPALMITTSRDIFNIEGAKETEREVARIYQAYGKSDSFGRAEDDTAHASTKKNREAMYAFFQKHLNNPGSSEDEVTDTLSQQDLQVTPTGQLATSLKTETIFSLNKTHTEQLLSKLQNARQDLNSHLKRVTQEAKYLSGYWTPLWVDKPVFTGRFQKEGYVIEKYFLKGEGDYVIPYLLLKPEHSNQKAVIYLDPSGKQTELKDEGELVWFVKNGFTVLAPDLVGQGEMGPGVFHGDSYIKGVSYNVWFASMLVGRSIVGTRAADVVRLTRLLKRGYAPQEILALAKKDLCPVLLHAAAFDAPLDKIALVEPYTSYSTIALQRYYFPGFVHSLVPGALTAYDLPDLAAGFAPRKLLIVSPTDGEGDWATAGLIDRDFSVIRRNYEVNNAVERFITSPHGANENHYLLYEEWLK